MQASAERAIEIEHQLEPEEPIDAGRNQHVGSCRRERARGRGQRTDQAIMRERARAIVIGHVARQHGLLERHQHADVAGRGVHGADEHHHQQRHDVRHIGQQQAGRRHDQRADQKKAAQIARGCKQAYREREGG